MFWHPWYMIIGGALISSPIIIHLINRMRFKRVRWAAMEFLLKSQKRNRRRLIIEQLILLLLRILLVLLAAFLVARFVGASTNKAGGTSHVVIIDDTPSMADRGLDEGRERDAFGIGSGLLGQLADNAQQANSAQFMQAFVMSDLTNPIFSGQLGASAREDIEAKLKALKPGFVHIKPLDAVKRGGEMLKADTAAQKVLTIVSDFRDADWSTGDQELGKEIASLTEAGVNVVLLDAAHPFRKEKLNTVNNHPNLAITDLRADTRIAAEGIDVELTVVLQNYGPQVLSPYINVYVDGRKEFRGSQSIQAVPPQGRYEHRFSLSFQKKKAGPEFVTVTADVTPDAEGLAIDHVRDLVLEVRKRVPVLLVDGSGADGLKERGDSHLLKTALESAKSFEIVSRSLEELEATDLAKYATIFLLNVPEIPSEPLQKKLKAYAENGGSLAFFLGDKVKPAFYNEVLHNKLDGLFPVLIDSQPVAKMSEEEKKDRRQIDEQPKLLFPDKKHPVVAGFLVPVTPLLRFLIIDQYYPPQPRARWQPGAQKETTEVITMASRKSIDDHKERSQELVKQALKIVGDQRKEAQRAFSAARSDAERAALKPALDEMTNFERALERHQRNVVVALGTPYLGKLVVALENMLEETAVEKNADRPGMDKLWALPKTRNVGQQIRDFKKAIEFGDPLLLARRYGRGHTVAFLSSAGTASKWNEWGADGPAQDTYAPFIMDLQRYLISGGEDATRLCSNRPAGLKFAFDPAKYAPEMRVTFLPQPDMAARVGKEGDAPARQAETRTVQMQKEDKADSPDVGKLVFRHDDAKRPGVYTFEVDPLRVGAGAELEPEGYAYTFNVDSASESDLRRSPRDSLVKAPDAKKGDGSKGRVILLAPGESFELFKNRDPDASESPWLYLLILLVLIGEQAMAVHLSFHTRGGEQGQGGTAPAPKPAPSASAA